jgi:hypothetical protein
VECYTENQNEQTERADDDKNSFRVPREYLEIPSESLEYQWFCSSFKRSLHHYYTIF